MDPILFVLTLLGSVLIQVGANLTDEYCDHSRGTGELKFAAPHKVIQAGLLSPQAVLRGAFLSFGAGSLIGLYLAAVAGWPILAVGIASVLAAYFHSAGPRPLGSIGLGELTVFFFMGPLMVGATYFVQVGQFSAKALWSSLPVGFLVAAILLANNIRDIDEDRALRKATLATMLGSGFASHVYCALLLSSFLASASLVFWGLAPPWVLVVFLCLPKAFSLARMVAQYAERSSVNRALRGTAGLHLQFGMLMVAGLVVSRFVGA
jgi:1,4-dihydroxy-2-naphthoate octaprenyltransferase